MSAQSIQARRYPDANCFGCGQSNANGLRLQSFVGEDGQVFAEFTPAPEHSNGHDSVNGGILSTILDCHAVATAVHALDAPFAVTKQFNIEFLAPAPMQSLTLTAWVTEQRSRSAQVEATASAAGQVCARLSGVFVVPRGFAGAGCAASPSE